MKTKKKVAGHEEEQEVVEYIGDGSYLPGVPARDLTMAEWKHHKKTILACPTCGELYEIPEDETPKEPEKESAATQEDGGNG